jgi:hypothetical protein
MTPSNNGRSATTRRLPPVSAFYAELGLTMTAPSSADEWAAHMGRPPLYDGDSLAASRAALRFAENECAHGALPFDADPPCDCYAHIISQAQADQIARDEERARTVPQLELVFADLDRPAARPAPTPRRRDRRGAHRAATPDTTRQTTLTGDPR